MTVSEARTTFARLMAAARGRTLTAAERARLTQARQVLRRDKRPAMNTKPRQAIQAEHADVFIHNARTSDYESIDRDMSSWVVTSKKLTTRFFLTDEGMATDIPSRAKRFRYYDQAEKAAYEANKEPAWHGFKWKPMSVPEMMSKDNPKKLTRRKARTILHEGQVRGRKLTERQRKFFGARASGYSRKNPTRGLVRLGRTTEIRYRRTVGRQPGYYKHEFKRAKANLYIVSGGWVYVPGKSIVITEGKPRV